MPTDDDCHVRTESDSGHAFLAAITQCYARSTPGNDSSCGMMDVARSRHRRDASWERQACITDFTDKGVVVRDVVHCDSDFGYAFARRFGSYGMLATGVFGGLISSASTTAAAATLAMHGKISAPLAGSTTVLASLASAAVNLPIVWQAAKDKAIVRRLAIEVFTVIAMGVAAVAIDRIFQFSKLLLRKIG